MTIIWRIPVLALLLALAAIGSASAKRASLASHPLSMATPSGIDAPESSQLCVRSTGERWRCGQRASFALADRIGRATVRCDPRDLDRYGRVVAICFKGSEDLNRWMVASGWAVAFRRYSLDYVADEAAARRSQINIWSGDFEMPWEWRAQHHNR